MRLAPDLKAQRCLNIIKIKSSPLRNLHENSFLKRLLYFGFGAQKLWENCFKKCNTSEKTEAIKSSVTKFFFQVSSKRWKTREYFEKKLNHRDKCFWEISGSTFWTGPFRLVLGSWNTRNTTRMTQLCGNSVSNICRQVTRFFGLWSPRFEDITARG